MPDVRGLLRGLPVLAGELPRFDPADTPAEPDALFLRWLAEAVDAGVREPHAMTLCTVDGEGMPDTRVLILKDVDGHGWQFATDRDSAKGRQAAAHPVAALGFHWREQGRQIRVRGKLVTLGPAASAADFLARPVPSRVASLASTQSAVLADPADLEKALAAAERTVAETPGTVAEGHTVYAVVPFSAEFWQGDASRRHVRLRYRLDGDSWIKERLWP